MRALAIGLLGLGVVLVLVLTNPSPEDHYNLALRHRDGDGLEVDPERALGLFMRAADGGHTEAQVEVAIALLGRGRSGDTEEAYRYFRLAADQGHLDSARMAQLLESGAHDVAGMLTDRLTNAKARKVESDLEALSTGVELYLAAHGELPASLSLLLPSEGRRFLNLRSLPRDPWGNHYVLKVPSNSAKRYSLLSYGRDGVPGGSGDERDRELSR